MDLFLRAFVSTTTMTAAERQEAITAIARKLLRGVISWEEALALGKDHDVTETDLEDTIDKIVRG